MIEIINIKSKEELTSFIEGSKEGLRVLKIGAPWCGPCNALENILKNLDEEKISGVLIGEINIEDEDFEDSLTLYNVKSIPVLLYFKNGIDIKKSVGSVKTEDIYKNIEELK